MKVTIPIAPVAKERARKGQYGNFYTPEKTEKAELGIGMIARTECNKQRITFKEHQPLEVKVTFWLEQPKRCKYDYPVTRPDLDNYIKLVIDALKGIIPDDSQIVHIDAWKKYIRVSGVESGFIELEIKEKGSD